MLHRLLAIALIVCAAAASAQSYPTKPIKLVTSGAGGGNDIIARIIAAGIAVPLGQPVVVDNRGGFISAEVVSKAPPDGYNILVAGSTFWLAPFLYEKISFDPIKDFLPITVTDKSPSVIVVHPSLPVNSVKDLIAYAKARPGQLNYSSATTGAPNHLAGELFKYLAGVDIVRVAYKNPAQERADLLSGVVQTQFPSAGSAMALVKAGKLRAVGQGSKEASVLTPGIPPVAASGLPDYEMVSIRAVFATAGTPQPIIGRLNQEIVRHLRSADVREKLLASSVESVGSTPDELMATVRSEMARMGPVIKAAGIRAE